MLAPLLSALAWADPLLYDLDRVGSVYQIEAAIDFYEPAPVNSLPYASVVRGLELRAIALCAPDGGALTCSFSELELKAVADQMNWADASQVLSTLEAPFGEVMASLRPSGRWRLHLASGIEDPVLSELYEAAAGAMSACLELEMPEDPEAATWEQRDNLLLPRAPLSHARGSALPEGVPVEIGARSEAGQLSGRYVFDPRRGILLQSALSATYPDTRGAFLSTDAFSLPTRSRSSRCTYLRSAAEDALREM